MKRKVEFGILFLFGIIIFFACQKTDDMPTNSIEGVYIGNLTMTGSVKSALTSHPATAEIKFTADSLIDFHCIGANIDTTLLLNHFNNYDSIMVCLTGVNFEHMYGHMTEQSHMHGGMMGTGSTIWQNHLINEHKNGDVHFGGFDMSKHTFGYTFVTKNGNLQFNGKKK